MQIGEPEIFNIPIYEMYEYCNYEFWEDVLGCSCGGVYKFIDSDKTSSQLGKFKHKCNKCGTIVHMDSVYPHVYKKLK